MTAFELMQSIRDTVKTYVLGLECYKSVEELPRSPNSSGIYFVYDPSRDEIIYVGKTIRSLFSRWENHPLRDYARSSGLWIYSSPNRAHWQIDLLQEEAFFILSLMPTHNRSVKISIPKFSIIEKGTQK